MPPQALYRKWRPQLWEEVVGQDHVVQTLRNALRSDRIAHAYLFSGPRGCGKTTSARLVAKALNCLQADPGQRPDNTCANCVAVTEGRFLDLIEIDGASNNGVENIRDLREKINFAPGEGRFKVYIIDEVHMLSMGAFNALLKTLEEPPPHAVFILATTESYKVPATVSSRCQRFEFRRIPVSEIVARLETMCSQEGIEYERPALEIVARQATGSLRDAISLLDQLVGAAPAVTLASAQQLLGTSASQSVLKLVEALAAGDLSAGLEVVSGAVDAGADPRQMARQMVDYLRNLMLVRSGNAAMADATADVRAVMARQAERLPVPALLRAIRAFNAAANDSRGGWQPQLPLELAVVECTRPIEEQSAIVSAHSAAPVPERHAPSPARPTERQHNPAESKARPAQSNVADKPVGRAGATRPEPAARSPGGSPAARTVAVANPAPVGAVSADVKTHWAQLLKLLNEQDKVTAALLRSCNVIGLDGSVLRLSTNEFVIDKLRTNQDTRGKVETAVTAVFGAACVVKFELAGKRPRAARGDDIPQDGLVATALDLGGEIVEE